MKTSTIALISTSVLASVFFFGWVLPEVPWVNRLKKSEIDKMAQEVNKLYTKNSAHQNDKANNAALTQQEMARWDSLIKKAHKSGYQISRNGNTVNYIYDWAQNNKA